MRQRVFRGVVSVMLAAAIGATGVVKPQQAQAQVETITIGAWVGAISSIVGLFGGDGGAREAIEAAKREILAEITASERRIIDHIDEVEGGRIAACLRDSTQFLINIDNYTASNREDRADQVTHCANIAGETMKVVQSMAVTDYLGYAIAEVNAIATVFRARTNLDIRSQLANYVSDYEFLVDKLEPRCTYNIADEEAPGGLLGYRRTASCQAYNGDFALQDDWFSIWDPEPPVDWERLIEEAGDSTSWLQARDSLPILREALAKAERNFITTGIEFGQTVFFSADGPLVWDVLGNPGTATAVGSTLAPGNRRLVVTVIDSQVHARIRNANGSWSDGGSLGHPGTAAAVTAAAATNGQTHVAAVINGQIHHRIRVDETSWTPWAQLGNPGTATALSGTVEPSGRLFLAAVIDGRVWHIVRNTDGSWDPWEAFDPAGTATSVAAVADPQGMIQVAAVADGRFLHRGRIGTSWTSWGSPGGDPSPATAVTGAVDPNGDVQFALVVDGGVLSRTRLAVGAWSAGWTPVGESFGMTAIAAS